MPEVTGISWCDATFNPWWGCQKVSPACDHCYAERDAKRFAAGSVLWGVGSERRTFGDKHWKAPRDWAKTMPAKLGRRPRVFCASMGDWLDLDAPLDQFVRLLDTIRLTPELDWLQLSKRIGNLTKRLQEAEGFLLGVADAQAERIDGLSTRGVGGTDDRRAGAYLEGREAHRRSMERRDEAHAVQARQGGAEDAGGLPAGEIDDRRQAALRGGGAAGLAALQGADPAGPDGQPHARQQGEQSTVEAGAGDLQRTASTRGEDAWRARMGSSGVKAPEDDADRGQGDRHAPSARRGRDGQVARNEVRHQSERSVANLSRRDLEALLAWVASWLAGDAPANVWLGATIVNQDEYDRDIGKVLRTPARVRFLSVEPMLGPIDMRMGGASLPDYSPHQPLPSLSWVICGGESGPHARPMHPGWVRSLRNQCKAAGVAFHFKQWGEWAPYDRGDVDSASLATPRALDKPVQRFGKKAAGRQLDGRTHDGFPPC